MKWCEWIHKKKHGDPFGVPCFLVPVTGIEPVRCFHRQILSLLRLPVSPHRLMNYDSLPQTVKICKGNRTLTVEGAVFAVFYRL